MSKSNVNPNHYKVAGRDRQGEDILQARHKQKHAQSLARERFEPRLMTPSHAGLGRGALVPGPPPGPSPKSTANQASATKPKAQQKAATARSEATAAAKKKPAKTGAKKRPASPTARRAPANAQGSDKRGKRSTAQKRASSRR